MPSIDSIKASNGSGNANTATVTVARSGGATTLQVDTVTNIPANFHATMGTPHTFTDPVTSEDITVISEATAVDFKGHVDGSNLEIDTIAPGYTDGGSEVGDIVIIRPTTQWANEAASVLEVSHNDDGTLKVADGGDISDENGNEQIEFATTASAVNHTKVTNAATGNAPVIEAAGGDTDIHLKLAGKGDGDVYYDTTRSVLTYRDAPGGNVEANSSTPVSLVSGSIEVPDWATRAIISFSCQGLVVTSVSDGKMKVLIGTDETANVNLCWNSYPINTLFFCSAELPITLTSTGTQTLDFKFWRSAGSGAVRFNTSSILTAKIEFYP